MLAKEELRKKPQAEPGLGRGIHLPQPVGGKGSETGKKRHTVEVNQRLIVIDD